ncbi:hypothetical protein Acsp06_45740 [Actinomycetospora sp. NBRC 106375]|uniref:hypothetical protein n=1 Tax=Actinomycetospora sp. NBRC 106375 TaxID=3032207 RepID=UPI0024A28A37|nr:hypothetical protein [Actinomycetospora sp. NBRC 106375]GLZ48389.1 hypothetical protein Acsp06_45740 [Actinomycetospora sp. NBRC 106375]
MTSPVATASPFDEPWSVLLVVTGVLVLPAGTGLQVLWLIVVGLAAALIRVRAQAVPPSPPTESAER